jgi:hypothetical protein
MFGLLAAMAALGLAGTVSPSWAAEEFDEAWLRIELNATDGDAGLHGKFDGGPWQEVEIKDPRGRVIYEAEVSGRLARRGGAESFFEGAEPPCAEQPLRAFLRTFPEGTYKFRGTTSNGQLLKAEFDLSHALPAAPDISGFDGSQFAPGNAVVIAWAPGTDLGQCHDQTLVDNGSIPDPAGVPVDRWEVAVGPDEDELAVLGLPKRVFSVQVPFAQQTVTIPAEYLQPYVAGGVKTFKFEVGAHGEGTENQTFSEGSFTIE